MMGQNKRGRPFVDLCLYFQHNKPQAEVTIFNSQKVKEENANGVKPPNNEGYKGSSSKLLVAVSQEFLEGDGAGGHGIQKVEVGGGR
ncbi:hypothetical protein COLO4_20609 [Corchorus olitorius]|uniref:Uncharacterized protein n=1 Tax=Corchorus olitorius TaxID=93759 RepID=A0A1R3IYR4_9ROSI|nr:hypothetical protein COLO4_20609 [Corchorus olitorius]